MLTQIDFKNKATLHQKMMNVANKLLNESILNFGQNKFRLAEIEFYLFNEQEFKDQTTHKNKRQLSSDYWYFHRSSKNDILKPINRIGLDITCGNQSEGIYGGILIRAIQNLQDENDYVHGTAQIVDRILADLHLQLSDIVRIEEKPVDQNPYLSLNQQTLTPQVIFPCPRVGLGKNATQEDRDAPFRFITYAHKEHKDKGTSIFKYLKDSNWDIDLIKEEFHRKTI